jgi:hypothetical protein
VEAIQGDTSGAVSAIGRISEITVPGAGAIDELSRMAGDLRTTVGRCTS